MKKVFFAIGVSLFMVSCGAKQKQEKLENEIAEMKMEQSQQRFEDSLVKAQAQDEAETKVIERTTVVHAPAASSSGSTQASSSSGTTTTTTTTKEKKGMSNAVKGALIGAGSGAVVGAVASKKKPGKGAVIGGLVGAGAGAATGAIVDAEKKKKEGAE